MMLLHEDSKLIRPHVHPYVLRLESLELFKVQKIAWQVKPQIKPSTTSIQITTFLQKQ